MAVRRNDNAFAVQDEAAAWNMNGRGVLGHKFLYDICLTLSYT